MGGLLATVAPIFIIMGLGWLMARVGRFPQAAQRAVTDFCFRYAFPALLFMGGVQSEAPSGPTAFAFFGAAIPLFLIGTLVGRKVLGHDLSGASMFGLNMSFGNTTMMGVPVILAAYGHQGLAYLLNIIALHSLVMLPLATMLAEYGMNAKAPLGRILKATGRSLLQNPIVMAVVVTQIWKALSLPVPDILAHTLTMMAGAGPPAALFCLGASLAGFSPRGAGTELALAVFGKLLVLPVMVLGACLLLGLPPLPTAVAVVSAGLPTGANAFILAQRYEVNAARSGATVLVASTVSVLTLSLLLAAMKSMFGL